MMNKRLNHNRTHGLIPFRSNTASLTILRSFARIAFVTLSLMALLSSCSRKSENSTQSVSTSNSDIMNEFPLLAALPETTFGFYTGRYHGKAYEAYNKSPWVQLVGNTQSGGALADIGDISGNQMAGEISQTLNRIGQYQDSIREYLLFVSKPTTSAMNDNTSEEWSPDISFLFECRSQSHCDAIQKAIKSGEIENLRSAENNTYILDLNTQANKGQQKQAETVMSVVLKQEGLRFAGSTNPALLNSLLISGDKNSHFTFPEALKGELGDPIELLNIGYIETQTLHAQAANKADLTHLPPYALIVRSFNNETTTRAKALLSDETLELPLLQMLRSSDSIERLFPAPEGLIFELGTSSALLQSLAPYLPPALSAKTGQVGAMQFAVIDGGASSPFPALTLAVQTSDPVALKQTLKDQIAQSLASGGVPVDTNWRDIEEEDRKISFIMSPLGIGLFLAETPEALVIATAKGAIDELYSQIKPLKAESKDEFRLVSGSIDFAELTKAVESVQASLSMFTGGETFVTKEQIDALRSLGKGSSKIALKGNELQFHSVH